jgi:hypothetical protein
MTVKSPSTQAPLTERVCTELAVRRRRFVIASLNGGLTGWGYLSSDLKAAQPPHLVWEGTSVLPAVRAQPAGDQAPAPLWSAAMAGSAIYAVKYTESGNAPEASDC